MKVRLHVSGREPEDNAGRDSVRAPLAISMFLHAVIFGLALFGSFFVTTTRGSQFGEIGVGGNSVPVNMTPSVPLPSRNVENPLASDTKQVNPAEIQPVTKTPPPQPNSKELQIAEKDAKKRLAELEKKMLERELAQSKLPRPPDNAVPGRMSGGPASSQMYGISTSQGAAGIGFSGGFGAMFDWYVRAVRTCLAQHWDQSRIDTPVTAARRVYLEFDIKSDGTFEAEHITQSSSIPSVDREAVR